jgi:hypothetical protein
LTALLARQFVDFHDAAAGGGVEAAIRVEDFHHVEAAVLTGMVRKERALSRKKRSTK